MIVGSSKKRVCTIMIELERFEAGGDVATAVSCVLKLPGKTHRCCATSQEVSKYQGGEGMPLFVNVNYNKCHPISGNYHNRTSKVLRKIQSTLELGLPVMCYF